MAGPRSARAGRRISRPDGVDEHKVCLPSPAQFVSSRPAGSKLAAVGFWGAPSLKIDPPSCRRRRRNDPMRENDFAARQKFVTSELLAGWLVALHFSRLFVGSVSSAALAAAPV